MVGVRTLFRRRERFVPPEGSYLLATAEQQYIGRPQELFWTPALSRAHGVVIGQTGSGKTSLFEFILRQMLRRGRPFLLLDLAGDLSVSLRRYIAHLVSTGQRSVAERVVWCDAADATQTATFNPLEAPSGLTAATQLLELTAAMKRHWADSWGPRLESCLLNLLAVLQAHELTLAEAPLVIGDADARRRLLADDRVSDTVRDYFQLRFDPLPRRDQVSISESTLNKVGALLSDVRMRTLLGEPRGSLNPKDAIAKGMTVLCRIPRGELVEHADLLASLLLASFHTAGMARVNVPPEQRRHYTLVLDEGQVASETFPQLLSGGRAFGLSVLAGVQLLEQLPRPLVESLLANTQLRACFRLGRHDAERLAKELFRADGDHVKYQERDVLGSRKSRPMFWNTTEEWEYAIRELQDQEPRECVIQLARGLPWFAETVDVPTVEVTPDAEALVARRFTRHLRRRDDVQRAITERRRLLTNPPTTKGGSHDEDDALEMLA